MSLQQQRAPDVREVDHVTFTELVGAQMDSPFSSQVRFIQTSAISEISSANRNVGSGETISIQLSDQSVLYFLDKSYMIFNLSIPCPRAGASPTLAEQLAAWQTKFVRYLFELVSVKIGSIQNSYSNEFYLQVQKHQKRKVSDIQKHGQILMAKCQQQHVQADWVGQQEQGANFQAQLVDVQLPSLPDPALANYGYAQYTVGVPLSMLIDQEYLQEQCLYNGMGQTIVINIRSTEKQKAFFSGEVIAAPHTAGALVSANIDYVMRNMSLIKCYAPLEFAQEQQIMKSVVPMPMLRYYNFPIAVTQTSNVLIFSIGEAERVRSLYCGFHANADGDLPTLAGVQTIVTRNNVAGNESVGYGTQHNIQSCYPIPLYLITISICGNAYTIDQNQLQSFFKMPFLGAEHNIGLNPLQYQLQASYKLDLTRFTEEYDTTGSSYKQAGQIQITLLVKLGTTTFFQQTVPWSSAAPNTVSISNIQDYQIQSFLETVTLDKECRYGVYR